MAESAWVIRESGLETGPNKRERGESQREAPNEFQDSTGRQGREREIVRTLLRMHVRTNVRKVTLFFPIWSLENSLFSVEGKTLTKKLLRASYSGEKSS